VKIVLDVSANNTVAQLDALLRNAPDEIVGVHIKATQGLAYTDALASAFAAVCKQHATPFGYYDFMSNDGAAAQAQDFAAFLKSLPAASLVPMLDCEGAYQLYALGADHWEAAFGMTGALLYAQLSNMAKYTSLPSKTLKWVAQYDTMSPYVPALSEIEAYKNQGYALWQYTSAYDGRNQDASVLLLDSIDALKIA
jgi:GH25 family lysozyme M1 (1,4-beta-N-acetylmuramidase)